MLVAAFQQLTPLLSAIQAAGGSPLLVGGAVRDWLLGQTSKDIDIEVHGLAVDQLLPAITPFGRVDAVGRSFGVLKLRLPGGYDLDLALPQRRSDNPTGARGQLLTPDPQMTPQAAAARRDFTWNALALTPAGELLDFFGGQADLRAGIIRHCSAAFGEDPLRVLRAMQFAARFHMRLASETADVCRALLPQAGTLAIERVWGEWAKWAAAPYPAAGLRVLAETGWVAHYPELLALIGCPQDPEFHPEGDVFVHTGFVCDQAAQIARRDGLVGEARQMLVLAGLCHDLGKPATTEYTPEGRIRSPGHASAGVPLAEALLRRMGCFERISTLVEPLVREHMAHIGLVITPRSVRRLAARLAPATLEDWARLVEADHSGRPPLPPGAPASDVLALAHELQVAAAKPEPLIKGRDLLAVGMQPGPHFGELLRQAYEAQLDGVFVTHEAALVWLHERDGVTG